MYSPIIKDIDLSFRKNSLDNDVLYSIDDYAVKNMILNIILCENGEKFYDYGFGCGLYKYLFNSNSQKNKVVIVENLKTQIEQYIPQIKIDNIKIEYTKDNEMKINIIYKYNLNDEVNQLELIV